MNKNKHIQQKNFSVKILVNLLMKKLSVNK